MLYSYAAQFLLPCIFFFCRVLKFIAILVFMLKKFMSKPLNAVFSKVGFSEVPNLTNFSLLLNRITYTDRFKHFLKFLNILQNIDIIDIGFWNINITNLCFLQSLINENARPVIQRSLVRFKKSDWSVILPLCFPSSIHRYGNAIGKRKTNSALLLI